MVIYLFAFFKTRKMIPKVFQKFVLERIHVCQRLEKSQRMTRAFYTGLTSLLQYAMGARSVNGFKKVLCYQIVISCNLVQEALTPNGS